jgi:cell wall-associated NlpC family hydrolase
LTIRFEFPKLRPMREVGSVYSRFLRVVVVGGLVAVMMSTAQASPDVPSDVVAKFLAQHGLTQESSEDAPAQDTGFVHQMRTRASELVLTSMNFLGVPYRRGGNSEEAGFDCSGFTRRIFEMSLGKVLPRRADEQAKAAGLTVVKRDELRPGDLVFFNTLRRTFSHVGIYAGDGKFIHAPRSGSSVRVDDMSSSYWSKRFTGGRRAVEAGETVPATTLDSASLHPSVQ